MVVWCGLVWVVVYLTDNRTTPGCSTLDCGNNNNSSLYATRILERYGSFNLGLPAGFPLVHTWARIPCHKHKNLLSGVRNVINQFSCHLEIFYISFDPKFFCPLSFQGWRKKSKHNFKYCCAFSNEHPVEPLVQLSFW